VKCPKLLELGGRCQTLGPSLNNFSQLHVSSMLELFFLDHVPLDALAESIIKAPTEVIVLKVSSRLWILILLLFISVVYPLVLGEIDCLGRAVADLRFNSK
jgi:hypothetical protein